MEKAFTTAQQALTYASVYNMRVLEIYELEGMGVVAVLGMQQ